MRITTLGLVLLVPAAPAQWQVQAPSPRPGAHQPTTVAFAGSGGFVTGMNNFPFGEHVLGSTDGGRSWARLFAAPVTTVHFADDRSNGWMVGDAAAFRTADGGASWQPMPAFPATSYQRVQSLGAGLVWATNTPWASGYPMMISEDRGLSWRPAQRGSEEVRIGDFATAQLGAGATASGIVRSTDGGRTWSLVRAATEVQDLRFLPSGVALAVRDAGMLAPGEILRSSDGGQTWTVVYTALGLGLGDALVPAGGANVLARAGVTIVRSADGGLTWAPVTGVDLRSASPGSIVHLGGGRVFVSSVLGVIFRSPDGGATWQQVFAGYGAPFADFAAADAQVVVAVGLYGGLLRSTDSGLTWAPVSNGLTLPNLDLAMWDRSRGIAIADQGFKLLTADGTTWIPQPFTSGLQQADVAVAVLDGGFAATVGRNQVHASSDYGRTWQALAPTTGSKWAIQFLTPSLGWVAGDAVRIEHTTDGGKTWTVQHHLPVRNALGCLDLVDAQNGWASGSGGVLLRTTDGRTWSGVSTGSQHPGATQTLRVDFASAGEGWVAGRFGFLAVTNDGGRTWSDRSLPGLDQDVTALRAVSASEAYAAAFHSLQLTSALLHTKDGGRTWRPIWSGDDAITRIERTPADELWLAATRGLIVHRDPGGAFAVFGRGCAGAAGIPALEAPLPPRLGNALQVLGSRLPPAATVALFLLGGSRQSWGTLPLPLDLRLLGMPGCPLRVSPDVTAGTPIGAGSGAWRLPIPSTPSLLATAFHVQVLAPDATANAAGAILSDAATAWIGR